MAGLFFFWCNHAFSSYHEWVHVVSLGLQVAAISHPIVLWDAIILHCGNIPPLKKLQQNIIQINVFRLSKNLSSSLLHS